MSLISPRLIVSYYELIDLIPFCIAEQKIYTIIIMQGIKSEIRSMLQGIQ